MANTPSKMAQDIKDNSTLTTNLTATVYYITPIMRSAIQVAGKIINSTASVS